MIRDAKPSPLDLSPPSPPPPPPSARVETGLSPTDGLAPPTLPYLPPNSAFDWDDDEEAGRRGNRGITRRTTARVCVMVLDFAHAVICLLSVAIVASFFSRAAGAAGTLGGPASVVAVCVLVVDILLDVQSVGLFDRPWIGWCLMLRSVCAISYLAVFLKYATSGGAFPSDYAYWGVPATVASPLLYFFLWTLLAWDAAHTMVHRHRITSEAKRYFDRVVGEVTASPQSRGWWSPQGGKTRLTRARPDSVASDLEVRSVTEIIPAWERSTDMLLGGRAKSGSVSTVTTASTASSAGSSWSTWSEFSAGSVTVPAPAREALKTRDMRLPPRRPTFAYPFSTDAHKSCTFAFDALDTSTAHTAATTRNRPTATPRVEYDYDFTDARWHGLSIAVRPALRYEAVEKSRARNADKTANGEARTEAHPGEDGVGVAL